MISQLQIQMTQARSLSVYLVLGEESGDALAVDMVEALRSRCENRGLDLELKGLAGSRLQAAGMQSLFDIDDIAVMGLSAVLGRLPTIVRRVYQTVSDIVKSKPDVIVLIDSPDFTHAVAKRVRKKLPHVPIINYVCPSVWAWRSGRAKSMCAYVDHVLALLPFEPQVLEQLGGPPATYVGHPLARQVAALGKQEETLSKNQTLLVLPGSRRGEMKKMLDVYGKTLEALKDRGVEFNAVIPAVPKLKEDLLEQTRNWPVVPQIVDSADNAQTFATARAALATSGTVALELALHRVPMVMGYRIDPVARLFASLITTWTAILPNLIVDRVLVPEEHNEMVIPERMARYLERLMMDSPERRVQLVGFDQVIRRMETKQPSGERAADVVFDHVKPVTNP